jgi:nitrogen-specific signal transduction histidine kinase
MLRYKSGQSVCSRHASFQRGKVGSRLDHPVHIMSTAPSTRTAADESWEHAPLPCLLLDRLGRIHAANRAAASLLEREPASLLVSNILELFSPASPLDVILRSPQAFAAGDPVDGQLVLAAGPPRPVRLQAQWSSSARREGLLVWIHDRSDVQNLQRRLERSKKLSAIAIVAGKVSHEICSPLNAIFLTKDLLQERVRCMRGPQGQRLLHYCRVLEEEVERLNKIVERYLTLARLAGGECRKTDSEEFSGASSSRPPRPRPPRHHASTGLQRATSPAVPGAPQSLG